AAALNPGSGLFDSLGLQNPSQFTAFQGRLFLTATNAGVGRELWSTDGTRAGTYLVRDINIGPANGLPGTNNFLTVAGNWLYFAGDDGQGGSQLWKTDGTSAGTTLVRSMDSV